MGTPSTRIWRTVVFAGAMLGTPLAGCTSSSHTGSTHPAPAPAPAPAGHAAKAGPDEAALEADRQNAREQELLAQKQAEEEAARKAEEEAAQAEADRKAEEDRQAAEEAARRDQVERVRGKGGGPRGRGFVLG